MITGIADNSVGFVFWLKEHIYWVTYMTYRRLHSTDGSLKDSLQDACQWPTGDDARPTQYGFPSHDKMHSRVATDANTRCLRYKHERIANPGYLPRSTHRINTDAVKALSRTSS